MSTPEPFVYVGPGDRPIRRQSRLLASIGVLALVAVAARVAREIADRVRA